MSYFGVYNGYEAQNTVELVYIHGPDVIKSLKIDL